MTANQERRFIHGAEYHGQKKLQVGEALRLLTGIVDSMEAAGIRIISATASTSAPYVLAFTGNKALRKWASDNELDVKVERFETEDDTTALRWRLTTEISGVEIRAYMLDEEKEAWDCATV